MIENYWRFAIACAVLILLLVRYVFRERITLQASLAFLLLTVTMAVVAVVPGALTATAQALGFTLISNFLFAITIGTLVVAHVSALVSISRLEVRSVALMQELAILREELDRTLAEKKGPAA
jgi:hypothetical protein